MARIAQRTLAMRAAGDASEVRRLLDADLEAGKISGYRWQRTLTPASLPATCRRTQAAPRAPGVARRSRVLRRPGPAGPVDRVDVPSTRPGAG